MRGDLVRPIPTSKKAFVTTIQKSSLARNTLCTWKIHCNREFCGQIWSLMHEIAVESVGLHWVPTTIKQYLKAHFEFCQ